MRKSCRTKVGRSLDDALAEFFRVEALARRHNDPEVWIAIPQWAFLQIADLVNDAAMNRRALDVTTVTSQRVDLEA